MSAQLCGVAVDVRTIPEGSRPSPDWAPLPPRLVWPVTTPVAVSTTYRMPLSRPATQSSEPSGVTARVSGFPGTVTVWLTWPVVASTKETESEFGLAT